MTTFYIAQGDLLPEINAILTDAEGTVVDLTSASGVVFHMVRLDRTVEVEEDAEVVAAALGQVRYSWQDGDTDVAGIYQAEFIATFDAGTMTIPNSGQITVIVREKWSVPI